MPKTAPFSSSVAFLTPPTFPAPAPRKRFFDLIPTKILGFRTRKGRLPRRQYLARARLEFRAACASWYLRGRGRLVSPAACWPVGLADGWPLWRWMARAMLRLRACAAWYLCAGLRVWYLLRLPDWRRWRMAGRPADCRSWPPTCRPSARRADTPPPSEPPDLTACRRWRICRRDRLPRRSADLPPGRPEPPPRVFTAPSIVPG